MSERNVILLVEDDERDIFLIQRAFTEARVEDPLYVLHGGEEAIDYFKGVGRFANRAEYPLPSLLLLDLKMPGTNGFEVLSWIRSQPELRALRIIVLTTSSELWDVNQAYELGANSFLVKPADFESVVSLVQNLNIYWLMMDRTPEVTRPKSEQTEKSAPPPKRQGPA